MFQNAGNYCSVSIYSKFIFKILQFYKLSLDIFLDIATRKFILNLAPTQIIFSEKW